jgi:polysaccharide biosynthesis transport protein
MNEERSFHPLDYMSVVHRRRWWFLGPLLFCIVAGLITVKVWPKKYLSQAAIAIASPTLSGDFLRGVQSMDPNERQRAVSQQLLSPTVLERVVRDEKLNPSKPVSDVAGWLRQNVSENIVVPNPIGIARPDLTRGIDLFYMGYTDTDAGRAQRVTNRLASVFVEENSKLQTERAENTSEIIAQQLSRSEDQLKKLEDQLREKKERNMGRLPDQIPANVQMVNGARSQLESISTQLRSEQDRLLMTENQLQQMREGTGVEGMTSTGAAAVQASQKHIDDLQAELARDRALGYLDKHPEVIRLQQEIKQARTDLAAAHTQMPSGREELLKADPLYRQRLQERDASRLRLRELQHASDNARAQIGQYQTRVDAAPLVEQELVALEREYTMEKTRYSDLSASFQKAKAAEDVARKQAGERFSVLYPASLPDKPIEPQPLKIMALAVVAGIVLGAAAAVGREFFDRSVYDVRALQDEFNVPVLGEIPRIAA